MSKEVSFFNFSVNKILSGDQSVLDQARIRLLYYGFWIVFVAVGGAAHQRLFSAPGYTYPNGRYCTGLINLFI